MKRLSFAILWLCIISLFACDRDHVHNLKIMSYNIRHGEGMDNIQDLSRVADIIIAHEPDLIGLQEIDNYCQRSDSISQTQYLAKKTYLNGTFSSFMDYQGGEYGMATLSAFPLISTKHVKLPDGIYEPRTAIIHQVEIAVGCTIVFVNVHFDWIDGDEGSTSRLHQAKSLMEQLDTINAVIITGDFNCIPDSPTMKYFYENGFEFADKGKDKLSYQGSNKSEIDHLIYRSSKYQHIEVKNIMLLNEPVVSDHRPLVSELEIIYK